MSFPSLLSFHKIPKEILEMCLFLLFFKHVKDDTVRLTEKHRKAYTYTHIHNILTTKTITGPLCSGPFMSDFE